MDKVHCYDEGYDVRFIAVLCSLVLAGCTATPPPPSIPTISSPATTTAEAPTNFLASVGKELTHNGFVKVGNEQDAWGRNYPNGSVIVRITSATDFGGTVIAEFIREDGTVKCPISGHKMPYHHEINSLNEKPTGELKQQYDCQSS